MEGELLKSVEVGKGIGHTPAMRPLVKISMHNVTQHFRGIDEFARHLE